MPAWYCSTFFCARVIDFVTHGTSALVHAADDLGRVVHAVAAVAGVDALGREREEEVLADLATALAEPRQDHLFRRAGIGRALEDDELTGLQRLGDALVARRQLVEEHRIAGVRVDHGTRELLELAVVLQRALELAATGEQAAIANEAVRLARAADRDNGYPILLAADVALAAGRVEEARDLLGAASRAPKMVMRRCSSSGGSP